MSRVVRMLGRTKAYFLECKQNMAPMPDPEWYEKSKAQRLSIENLRKLPLSVHVEVWSTTWREYRGSFERSFGWGEKRKAEALKQEVTDRRKALQEIVSGAREATHNTPKDIEESKKALKELLEDIHANRDDLKSAAQEKLALIRVSLSEFSTGYREARDEEIKRVMSMDKTVLQDFLNERAGEVKHASTILSDAILTEQDKAADKNVLKPVGNSAPASTDAIAKAAATAAASKEESDSITPRSFLSKRARDAVDDVLHDPDIEQLMGRAGEFTRGRLLQAEAAARVFKGEEEAAGQQSRVESTDRQTNGGQPNEGTASDRSNGGQSGSVPDSEMPILSGIAGGARDFVSDRVAQVKDGATEVVEAATERRRSRRDEMTSDRGRGERDTKTEEDGGREEHGNVRSEENNERKSTASSVRGTGAAEKGETGGVPAGK